jgi:hypothetical protein
MVGCPGSGKTTIRSGILTLPNLSNKLFIFSPDEKSSIKEYKNKLNKTNLLFDSTNPSFKHRSKYYEDLKPEIYNFLIIHFNIDKLICKHLNHCRYHKTLESKEKTQQLVPEIAYRIYYKNYEDPNLDYSKLDDNFLLKVININNIKSILDQSKISSECYMFYDID